MTRIVTFLNPATRIVVQPGSVYRFCSNMSTRAGHTHLAGSEIHVLYHTKAIPYKEVGPNGYNLMCRTLFGRSCWSTLELNVERGMVEFVRIEETRDWVDDKDAIPPIVVPPPRSAWERLMEDEDA